MSGFLGKLEGAVAVMLWIGVALAMPMAALAPVDHARVHAKAVSAAARCTSQVVDTLRACPVTAL